MEKGHQDIIISNLSILVNETNLPALVPELLRRKVFTQRMIERILDPSHEPKRQKTDLYVEILKRGPEAFGKLQDALVSANHSNLANVLRMEARDSAHFQRSISLTSVGSNRSPYSSDNSESDGPAFSSSRKFSAGNVQGATKRPDSLPLRISSLAFPSGEYSNRSELQGLDIGDVREPRLRDPRNKVFNPPSYDVDDTDEWLESAFDKLTHEERKLYPFKRDLPVVVKQARDWKCNPPGGPRLYKMDSNPRGCALVINNMNFYNKVELPYRKGAENDMKRFKALLEQLHFTVEDHENKTKAEMLMIVEKFSQKPELKEVDCLWVTIMTHGGQGYTDEGEIVGVDGFGCKTSDIVSHFYNDACKGAIHKPKLFFFQACRGCLTDPGVMLPGGNYEVSLDGRITHDGSVVNNRSRNIRVRTHSDIFIAYPTHEGIRANRDVITGTWFIQTVVNVFSELSKDYHLEDMLKVVDERIKSMNNLQTTNFQAVSSTSIGWHRHLYFNPGLYRDRTTGATVRLQNVPVASESGEGTDEVDASSTSSDKTPNGVQSTSYARLKDDGGESSGNNGNRSGCCILSLCRTS